MKLYVVVGLLILLIGCSVSPPEQSDKAPGDIPLTITNGFRRGTDYTDSLGARYNLRYIPVTITNDSTIPLNLHLAFSKDYSHLSHPDFDERFKLIPMSSEWADTVSITNQMYDVVTSYIEKPTLDQTIEPGEVFSFAIGNLYGNPPTCGVIPKALFVSSNIANYDTCDSSTIPAAFKRSRLSLGIKLVFCGNCVLIPCGQVSYLEE